MAQIQEHVALAPLTTLGVGGPARFFVEAQTPEDIREALEFSRRRALPLFVLGGGSNLLVSDDGFDGLVVRVALHGMRTHVDGSRMRLRVAAGENWDDAVATAVAQHAAGLECLSGIPGTTGGTPVQNVGAYGQEVAQTITAVEAMAAATGESRTFSNRECRFGYRTSVFNSEERGRWIVLGVEFELEIGGVPNIGYRDLAERFRTMPTLAAVREAVLAIRAAKGMVLRDDDPDSHSAGSFFKNPVVSGAEFEAVAKRAAARRLEIPAYPADGERKKIPAAWLVEQAGFEKGFAMGRAGISNKHALAIVNRGGATAAEIIALKDAIQRAVREQFGVELQPEPVMVGFRS